jgi:hypothetical protein
VDCVAVILPRVQVHFDLSSKVVGLVSASTMAGVCSFSDSDWDISANTWCLVDDDRRDRLGDGVRSRGKGPTVQLDTLPHSCIRDCSVVRSEFRDTLSVDVLAR